MNSQPPGRQEEELAGMWLRSGLKNRRCQLSLCRGAENESGVTADCDSGKTDDDSP